MGKVCVIKEWRFTARTERDIHRAEFYIDCKPNAQPYEILHDLLDLQERNKREIARLEKTQQSLIKMSISMSESIRATPPETIRGTQSKRLDELLLWVQNQLEDRQSIGYVISSTLQGLRKEIR